jgi:hypothetical protein
MERTTYKKKDTPYCLSWDDTEKPIKSNMYPKGNIDYNLQPFS